MCSPAGWACARCAHMCPVHPVQRVWGAWEAEVAEVGCAQDMWRFQHMSANHPSQQTQLTD